MPFFARVQKRAPITFINKKRSGFSDHSTWYTIEGSNSKHSD